MSRITVLLVLVAAVIAAAVYAVIIWSGRWNNPELVKVNVYDRDVRYQERLVHVSINCKCPPVLTESVTRNLTFDFSLKESPAPSLPNPKVVLPTPSPSASAPAPASNIVTAARQANQGPEKVFYVWVDSANATTEFSTKDPSLSVGAESQLPSGIATTLPITITPHGADPVVVSFHFLAIVPGQPLDGDSGLAVWQPESHPTFMTAIAPLIYSGIVFACVCGGFFLIERRLRQLRYRTELKLVEARNAAASAPNETYFAWETAKIKLEAYFDRNLIQVNLVFWVAVFVMAVGFGFVLAGVILSLRNKADLSTAQLAAISGIITQFIGATFMVIYRSTMGQANEFMTVLERINTVGMAVHEMDRIADADVDLKNRVRAHVVELLLSANLSPHTKARDVNAEKKKPAAI